MTQTHSADLWLAAVTQREEEWGPEGEGGKGEGGARSQSRVSWRGCQLAVSPPGGDEQLAVGTSAAAWRDMRPASAHVGSS